MTACDRLDFVTDGPCVREAGHRLTQGDPGYHRLADGTAFAIGYTAIEAETWGSRQLSTDRRRPCQHNLAPGRVCPVCTPRPDRRRPTLDRARPDWPVDHEEGE